MKGTSELDLQEQVRVDQAFIQMNEEFQTKTWSCIWTGMDGQV